MKKLLMIVCLTIAVAGCGSPHDGVSPDRHERVDSACTCDDICPGREHVFDGRDSSCTCGPTPTTGEPTTECS